MKWSKKRITTLENKCKRLLAVERLPFEDLERDKGKQLPQEAGIYVLYEDREVAYVGMTKGSLRRRIYKNHFRGSKRNSAFRKTLMREKRFRAKNSVRKYMLNHMEVAWKEMGSEEAETLEHFMIAVLNPVYNGGKK